MKPFRAPVVMTMTPTCVGTRQVEGLYERLTLWEVKEREKEREAKLNSAIK